MKKTCTTLLASTLLALNGAALAQGTSTGGVAPGMGGTPGTQGATGAAGASSQREPGASAGTQTPPSTGSASQPAPAKHAGHTHRKVHHGHKVQGDFQKP